MKRTHVAIGILVCVAAALLYWLLFGRTVVVRLDGRRLPEVVNLSVFDPLKPDMRRSEIRALLGEPERVHVTDVEYDEDGEIEYQEIRWVFPQAGGVLAYYIEEYDTPGGSVEYIPENMSVTDLFRVTVPTGLGKRFVEIRNQGRCLMQVRLRDGSKVERVNWYWGE